MATTTTASVASAEGSAPPTGTNLVGIIVPPPARKVVIDKTAGFAAQYGRQIEEPLLARPTEKNAADFLFLLETNEFHAYYLSKIEELKAKASGGGGAAAAAQPEEPARADSPPPPEEEERTRVVAALAKNPPSGLVTWLTRTSQELTETSLPTLRHLTASQSNPDYYTQRWAVLALVARSVAANGAKFEAELEHRARESDPQLDFMLPGRPYHSDYLEVLSEYKRLLVPEKEEEAEVSRTTVLRRTATRYEVERRERLEDPKKQESERAEFLSIDWHDFVLVETIDFLEEQRPAEAAEEEALPVRRDYEVRGKRAVAAVPMTTLPDGRVVPASEASKHVKVELQDPKWREQQDRFEAKQRDTNMVTGAALAQNLAKLVRPGGGAPPPEAAKVIWDGSVFSADALKQQQQQQQRVEPPAKRARLDPPPMPPPAQPLPPPPVAGLYPPPPPHLVPAPFPPAPQAPPPQVCTLEIAVPEAGAPSTLAARLPTQLTLEMVVPPGGWATVQQVKERVADALEQVPLSKFQLVLGGRFLKNTDSVPLPTREAMEIKWKTK